MPWVKNQQLRLGRGSDGKNWAEVEYDIEFIQSEKQLALDFDERVVLIEVDDEKDTWIRAEQLHRGSSGCSQ